MKIIVTVQMEYEIPDDMDERKSLYGTTDPGECFKVDFDNDPAATLCDYAGDLKVISWKTPGSW